MNPRPHVAASFFAIALGAAVAHGQEKAAKPEKPAAMKMEKLETFPDKSGKQPGKPAQKIAEEIHPQRDFKPVSAAIDKEVDAVLASAHIPASPVADDAEFFRRVTLDIAGRIPTAEEAAAFFGSSDPERRAKWIDDLLRSASYGEHFATIWRELMLPRDNGMKGGRDLFIPWLTDEFNRNRGWDRIVAAMLTVEGKLREMPQSGFIMANTDNGEPQPNLLADATGRLFWGVQLRCAECHDHPFANWKQEDFWGTAAFFRRLRKGNSEGKNPSGWTLTESEPDEQATKQMQKVWTAPGTAGPAILIPGAAGKASGKTMKAKFLGGKETGWTDAGPFRERFAQWAVSAQNPWFTANTVNRLWAHFFTRGLVMPMDGFNGENQPSHPQLLTALRQELADSGFDVKHLIRCVCNSRAYQRSSRPIAGNERDEKLFSHRLVKVMRPEMLYDSISAALQPPGRKGSKDGKGMTIERAQPLPGISREEFVRFFGSRPDENEGSIVNQGIPQFLRLMNGPLLNVAENFPARSSAKNPAASDPVDAIFLTAYSRKPTDGERRAVASFTASADGQDTPSALLWTLLNSAEFVTNH